MAVGFNGSGEKAARAANIPMDTGTTWTICGWAKITSVRASAYQYFAGADDGSGIYQLLGYNDSGNFELSWGATSGGGSVFASNPSVGEWFYFALTQNGTGANTLAGRFKHVGGSWVSVTNGVGQAATSNNNINLGNDGYDDWCNVHLAYVRVWAAALTTGELDSEMESATPVKSGVVMDWPLADNTDSDDRTANDYDLTFSGTLTSETSPDLGGGGTTYNQSVSGGVTPAGAVVNSARKVVSGALTSSGALINSARKVLAGALTSAGELLADLVGGEEYEQAVGGSLTPSGVLVNSVRKVVAGALEPAGALVKRAGKALAGTITPEGPLGFIRDVYVSVAGALTPDGGLVRSARKVLAGAIEPSGIVATVKAALISLGGELTSAGGLVLQAGKSLAGSITPDGGLVRSARKVLAGVITPDGGLSRLTSKILSGELTPAGVLGTIKAALVSLAGAITPAGALVKQAGKAVAGSITPDGGLSRSISKALSGALTSAGSVVKSIAKSLAGALTSAGVLAAEYSEGGIVVVTVASLRTLRYYTPMLYEEEDQSGIKRAGYWLFEDGTEILWGTK